jgi:hypothetical protein
MLSPEIEISFGDGDYLCALRLPQLVELEDKCGFIDAQGNRRKRGVVAIYSDVLGGLAVDEGRLVAIPQAGLASASDCREVVRLGLIGGGRGIVNGAEIEVSPLLARQLVERHLDPRPIVEWWTMAAAILRAAIEGYDPGPNVEPARKPAPPTRRSRSKSAKSSSTAG